MPWYREGTVSVTAGQTTVTGTGTNFSLNARVGDAFQGPDGRWYEVANIASATVMGILPAYQGATVAAGVYGLAPMQGYVKEAADRLRQIVEQWGSTLASLGAVATENVVPIAKGGTGATTQEDARTALGATAVGAALFTAADAAAVRTQAGATPVGSSLLTAETPAAARGTLQLKSAAVADVVGTVTQAGGAIIETGSNANGTYIKYADGSMICRGGIATAALPPGSAVGALWTYPAAFISQPTITATGGSGGGNAGFLNVGIDGSPSGSAAALALGNAHPAATLASPYIHAIAIGRWF